MNISKLTHQMTFGKILNLYKDENGKINWYDLSDHPNLPLSFVDKYFYQLMPFGIESKFKLNDQFIEKWGNTLNWYNLLKYQEISMEILEKQSQRFNSQPSYWILVIKYQKLSFDFLMKIKNMFINNDLFIDTLKMNMKIENRIKNSFLSLL